MVAGGADLDPLEQAGVWERLLERVQEHGVELGMAFLDGTSITQSGGGAQKAGSGAQRDVREALGRSRGGYGTRLG
jgi:hypothetical protein